MELRHLRYFLAVATERNFTRASERLGVAQPPLSRQIRDLEEELGVTLFDRRQRPLTLTNAGRLLFEQATHVIEGADQIRTLLDRFGAAGRRRFAIGFVGSTIYGMVPRLIRDFRSAAPHADVNLIEMTTLEQIQALKEGRIDVGVGRIRFDDMAILREVLEEEALVAALPNGHKLLESGGAISLADLARETMVVYPRLPRPSYADQVLSLFRDHNLELSTVQEVRELQTAIGLVAAQAGVCIVPSSVQRLQRDDVVYRPLLETGATSPVIMSWRREDISDETKLLIRLSKRLTQVTLDAPA